MYAQGQTSMLKFHEGHFRIVQFTDLHWIVSPKWEKGNDSTEALMRSVIKSEKPDLVIFTGDIVVSTQPVEGWKALTLCLRESKTPFVFCLGNHDTETGMPIKQLYDSIRNLPCFFKHDEADPLVSGAGNGYLNIMADDNRVGWHIYLMDSHAYSSVQQVKGYDWIRFDQIRWYRELSKTLKQKNNGKILPALAFFHIPLPEYKTIANSGKYIGNFKEEVCSPDLNSGMLSSFIEMGDVRGIFTGHDHNNDYLGELYGICLAYGRKTGYNAAYKEVLPRGARVIDLNLNQDPGFSTYIVTLKEHEFLFNFPKTSNKLKEGMKNN